ncbi:hypothetical protein AGMMS50256_04520 [Betaproteobacteria bacterium]|nr:hypothetical protein AGMMS50256_04520 [Betaproteobacteria bacterium]
MRNAIDSLAFTQDGKRLFLIVALISSLFSLIATLSHPIVSKDSYLYIFTANVIISDDFTSAQSYFDWLFFPAIIGFLHQWSGLSLEITARVLCEVMTAIACAFTVDIVRRKYPPATLWAILAIFALPAFNEYRGDIIREPGSWCFSMGALWAMFVFETSCRKCYIWIACFSTGLAVLFRPEYLYLFFIFPIHFIFRLPKEDGKRKIIAVSFFSILVFSIVVFVLAGMNQIIPISRFARFNPELLLSNFTTFSEQLAVALPFKYAEKDVGIILFFGFFTYVLYKICKILGIFILPFIMPCHEQKIKKQWMILDIAALGYFAILVIFTFTHFFLSARYVSFLGFLCLPRIAQGLKFIVQNFPRSRIYLISVCIVLAISNVVSLSGAKTHVKEAGLWMKNHLSQESRIYVDEQRVFYYADWKRFDKNDKTKEEILTEEGMGNFDYFGFSLKNPSSEEINRLERNGLTSIARFQNNKGETFIIFKHSVDVLDY